MIYLLNRISTVFLFPFYFYCIFNISCYLFGKFAYVTRDVVTEQLVYFTRMTHTELPDFGGETLIPFLYQLPLDDFLFIVVCLDHACKCFCSDLCLLSSCFCCCYSFFLHV